MQGRERGVLMNALAMAWETETLPDGRQIKVRRAKAHVEVAPEPLVAPMSGIEGEGDYFLAEWARWTRGGVRLSYPSRSVTEKANEGGIMAGSPRPPTEMPEEVALTDKAIARLELRNRSLLRWAIELHYERSLPVAGMALEMRCCKSEAHKLLKRAQRSIYTLRESLR
jgi:hypothetical protein